MAFAIQASFAQDLKQPVEYSSVARPVAAVLADLAKSTGLNIQTAKTMANEYVIVGVKAMPLDQLLNRIAEVTTGKWEEADGRMLLVRDLSRMRLEEQNDRRRRLDALQKGIQKLLESLQPKKPDAKPGQNTVTASVAFGQGGTGVFGDGVNTSSPVGRAIVKLVAGLGANAFVDIGKDGRVVFATTPNRMQRSLPSNAGSILDQLVKEQNDYARKLEQDRAGKDEEIDAKLKEFVQMFGIGADEKPIERPAVKAILVAERQGFFPGIQVSLRLFDQQGKVLLNGMGFLESGDASMFGDLTAFMPGAEKKPAPKTDPNEAEIELSPLAKERDAMKMDVMNPAAPKPMSDALRQALLHPEEHDPLSFKDSEALIATAKAKNLDLVANLPDSISGGAMAFALGSGEAVKLTPSKYLADLKANKALTVNATDTELVVRPTNMVDARRERADRFALGTIIRAADTKGAASLADIAGYAAVAESPYDTPAATIYLTMFAPNARANGMSGMVNWNLLRFFGRLAPDQRQGLIDNGGRIAIGQLSSDQQNLMARIVFGANAQLRVDRPGEKPREEGGFMDMIASFMGNGGNKDFRDEPTEIMPNGLPPQGYVTIAAEKDYVVFPAEKTNPLFSQGGGMGSDELGMIAWMKEEPMFQQAAGFFPALTQLRLGNRVSYTIKFQLAESVSYQGMLRDDSVNLKDKPISFDQLPADFQARIDQHKEKFKKSGFPFDIGGKQGIPPR